MIKNRLLEEGFVVEPSFPATIGMPLSDVSSGVSSKVEVVNKSGGHVSPAAPLSETTYTKHAPVDEVKLPNASTFQSTQLQDLYDYVFDTNAKSQLDTYFKTSPSQSPSKKGTASCDLNSSQAFNTKALCETSIDKQFSLTKKEPIMETNHSFYKVYPNESILNGGLLGNVTGFDQIKDEYEQLS